MSKTNYLYINSKNRSSNEKIYDFTVLLNNPINLNRNQAVNISVIGFSMLNTDYNLKGCNFALQVEYTDPVIYYISYFITIPDGNYSYLTLLSYLNNNTSINPFIRFDYIKERNSINYVNISSYKIIITPNSSSYKILGLSSVINILTSQQYEGTYINLCNYSHIIIKSNKLIFEDSTEDNITTSDMSNSSILFIIDKQDIMPFQLISYRNYDKSDNFSYNISNRNINSIDLHLYNEKGEILTSTSDYFLILKIVIFNKEEIQPHIPYLDDIKFILMNLLFNGNNKNLILK